MLRETLGGADLYQKIAEEIRKNILTGVYQPGGQIPTIRELSQKWNCTPGTIQRAYRELARLGLVHSKAGKGTYVVNRVDHDEMQNFVSLRKAILIHRAESFLLESIIAGYSYAEVEESIDLARKHMQIE